MSDLSSLQAAARQNMIDSQLRPNRVDNPRLLAAFGQVRRDFFLPPSLAGLAYMGDAIPLGQGREMTDPTLLGRLIELAEIRPTDHVLHVACGSGYATAILSHMAASVIATEEDPALALAASAVLARSAIGNATVVQAPFGAGMASGAPYDVILIEGAIPDIPQHVSGQLKNGGRLVAVVGMGNPGRALQAISHNGLASRRLAFDATMAPLPGFADLEAPFIL